jgi:antitoxin CptB
MSEPRETRLKRLRMRAGRRGIKEMDLILAAFAAHRLEAMDTAALDRFDALLNENDQDLYAWVTGQQAPPARLSDLVAQIAAHAEAGVNRPA